MTTSYELPGSWPSPRQHADLRLVPSLLLPPPPVLLHPQMLCLSGDQKKQPEQRRSEGPGCCMLPSRACSLLSWAGRGLRYL